MKKLLINILLTLFTASQALAVTPLQQGYTQVISQMIVSGEETSQLRRPTVDSSTANFLDYLGNFRSGNNYTYVDDITGDDEYNYRLDSSATDKFEFTAFSVPSGATNIEITVYIRTRRTAAGAVNSQALLYVNATTYLQTLSDPGTSWTDASYTWTTNPNTSAAWTVADVNGTGSAPLTMFGYGGTGMATGEELQVTQVYMVVTWE